MEGIDEVSKDAFSVDWREKLWLIYQCWGFVRSYENCSFEQNGDICLSANAKVAVSFSAVKKNSYRI